MAKNKFFDYRNSSIKKGSKLFAQIFKENKILRFCYIFAILYIIGFSTINIITINKGLDYYRQSFIFRYRNIFRFFSWTVLLLYFIYFQYAKAMKLREQIIGYYKESSDTFLCSKCYSQTKDIDRQNYTAVKKGDLRNSVQKLRKGFSQERFVLILGEKK